MTCKNHHFLDQQLHLKDTSSNSHSHPIPPVFNADSRILILGSFPSVRSREEGFFYGHPRNRFWQVLHLVFSRLEEGSGGGAPFPKTTCQKKDFLLSHGIALWDVAQSCTVTGSSDSSIADVVPNDISPILSAAPISRIYTNGKKAHQLYNRHLLPRTGRPAICLPSTSPANASCSLERLVAAWRCVAEDW